MEISWRIALLAVAGAFVVFLIVKMLPRTSRRGSKSASLASARARAREAKTDRERAEALCDAAEAALSAPFGGTRSAAYFVRAMRADPTWVGAIERASATLAGRHARLLRRTMWRRLSHLPWDAAHAPALRALATAILSASKGSRAHAAHAAILTRLLQGETLHLPKEQ